MAKKINKTEIIDEDNFEINTNNKTQGNIFKTLTDKFGKSSIVLNDDSIRSVIRTGSVRLDRELGIGGLATGRIVEIFGAEQSGKTTLALHIIAEAQKNANVESFLKYVTNVNKKLNFKNIARVIYDCLSFINHSTAEEINTNLHNIVINILTQSNIELMTKSLQKEIDEINKCLQKFIDSKMIKSYELKKNIEKHLAKLETESNAEKKSYYMSLLSNLNNFIAKRIITLTEKYNSTRDLLIEILKKFIDNLDYLDWPEHFKSGVNFVEILNSQKNGEVMVKKAAFLDVEKSFNPDLAKAVGVNVNQLLLLDPNNAEQAFQMIDEMCRSNEINVIVVDSVAALIPQSEMDNEIGDTRIGLHAQTMSTCLKQIVSPAQNGDLLIVFINQVRHKLNIGYGHAANAMATTGGKALLFYSSIRLEVKKVSLLQDAKNGAYGQRVRVKIAKNKFAPPFREIEFDLLFGSGIDKYSEIAEIALELNIIQSRGAWIYMNETRLANGRANFIELLKKDNNLYNSIYDAVIDFS